MLLTVQFDLIGVEQMFHQVKTSWLDLEVQLKSR